MNLLIGTVLIALMLLLSGDRCTYPPRLIAHSQHVSNPLPLLFQAAKQHYSIGLVLLQKQVVESQHHHWFKQGITLLDLDQAHQLVMSAKDTQFKKQLLQQLARQGHLNSQYQYALLVENPKSRLSLMTKVAQQGHRHATVASYYLAKAHNVIGVAETWLPKAANYDVNLTLEYANLLWQQQGAPAALTFLESHQFNHLAQVQNTIAMVQRTSTDWVTSSSASRSEQRCPLRLQIVASTIPGISHALDLTEQFSQDSRFDEFPVCVNSPVWLDFAALDCSNDPQSRLSCKMEPLMELSKNLAFTHVMVIGQRGIANVHNGIMYLDLADDYTVFVHEFAHFAGFVDEYPISSALATQFCAQKSAANLVFTSARPDIHDTHFAAYLQESPDITLTETQTCLKVQSRAYKPVSEMTFLEHHDVGEVPDVYLRIWHDRVSSTRSLTPVYVNFAQWSDASGEALLAQFWWRKYNNYHLKNDI